MKRELTTNILCILYLESTPLSLSPLNKEDVYGNVINVRWVVGRFRGFFFFWLLNFILFFINQNG
jgi:hypothetical protein